MEIPKQNEHLPPPMPAMKPTRRRGRDVSSRYMIPSSPRSAPSSPIHYSSFTNPNPDTSDSESEASSRYPDENQPIFLTHFPLELHKQAPITQKRRAVRLFADNGGENPQRHSVEQVKGRPPTPMSRDCGIETPRDSLYCQNQLRSVKKNAKVGVKSKPVTPFPELMNSSSRNSCYSGDSGSESCSVSRVSGLCGSSPIRTPGSCRARQTSEIRSSMPAVDSLPTSSRKADVVRELMLRHSFNSMCQTNPLNLLKTGSNIERVFMSPQPRNISVGLGLKKGKKGLNRKEDVHAINLLQNQYLQWRFVNAFAKEADKARLGAAERSLFKVSKNLEGFRDSVREKRMELEKLLRLRRLSTIVDLGMPHLEQWALVDGEYSDSLSGTIKALKDASSRLPLAEDVKVDIRDLKESIHSATGMFESFSPSIERFLPKTIGIAKEMSELAKVVSREKALIEEDCEGLLSEFQRLQVEECSLRSMLMQVKRSKI